MSATAPVPDEFYTDLAVGEILRRARLQKKMTIEEAEAQLRIRAEQLDALERSDFDSLPGNTYVIGFVRTYAEFLGLDGGRVVHVLKRQSKGLVTAQAMNVHMLPTDSRLPSNRVIIIALACVVVIALFWAGYQKVHVGSVPYNDGAMDVGENLGEFQRLAVPVVAQPTEVPKPVLAPAPVSSVPEAQGVVVQVVEETWIELRNPEGRVVEARMFQPDESFVIEKPVDEFGNAYVLTMGNAAGVVITLDGRALPKFGGADEVRRNVSLNPRALRVLGQD